MLPFAFFFFNLCVADWQIKCYFPRPGGGLGSACRDGPDTGGGVVTETQFDGARRGCWLCGRLRRVCATFPETIVEMSLLTKAKEWVDGLRSEPISHW